MRSGKTKNKEEEKKEKRKKQIMNGEGQMR